MTVLLAIRFPTSAASCFGAPSRIASGPSTQPKTVWSENAGFPQKWPTQPRKPFNIAIRATNAISIAEMFRTQRHPLRRPGGRRVDEVRARLLDLHLDGAHRRRAISRLRPEDLGDQERPGRRHDRGRDQVLQRRAHRHVGEHHGPGDVRHAARHHRQELRRRHGRDVGRDQDRRLGLADEDVGRDAERLGARDLHRLLHHPGHPLDEDLDDAEVVEEREERADEDDDRKDLEGEDEAPERQSRASRRASSIGPASQPKRNDEPLSAYPIAFETLLENASSASFPLSQ